MPPTSKNRFERDTAVTRTGDDAFQATIDPGWWIMAGPNGGYVAAILMRALTQAVADTDRAPRSLSVHFTARPEAGPAAIETRIERRGRSLTNVTARMLQGDRLLCLAVAAFSHGRDGFAFSHAQMPEVAPPKDCPRLESPTEMHRRYECRWAIGAPPFEADVQASSGNQALNGSWIRLAESGRTDAALVTAYTDALPPAIFSLLNRESLVRGVPTVDMTIHFRRALPLPGATLEDFCLAVFRSRQSADGFMEEDGEIWSRDGVLLAQSRQLALVT